ncbi:small polypeptide DEVIL 21-like [Apium graveolens]|uniref:small polypeptide DEVIL 21-like n=1 Tax=Apium graveolens TaxID=4045 RepID=UPI003D7B6DC1
MCIYMAIKPGLQKWNCSAGGLNTSMGRLVKRFAKWKKFVRQQKGKLYIMRECICMLLCWDKYS